MHERASLHLERLFTESGENVSWKGKPDELLRNIPLKSRRDVVIVG